MVQTYRLKAWRRQNYRIQVPVHRITLNILNQKSTEYIYHIYNLVRLLLREHSLPEIPKLQKMPNETFGKSGLSPKLWLSPNPPCPPRINGLKDTEMISFTDRRGTGCCDTGCCTTSCQICQLSHETFTATVAASRGFSPCASPAQSFLDGERIVFLRDVDAVNAPLFQGPHHGPTSISARALKSGPDPNPNPHDMS